ncbi:MAG: NTP transferase domain-containing protein [Clostridia bacterium]|nr:NTP transferase domain-containing protein [Clostridia bacterium]
MTLVILAAGMGSRYGGLKQLDPITKAGEFIIDFSVYDAIRAGFDKVVFIIKKENYELFRETVGSRVEPYIKTEYAFQQIDNIPEGFSVPEGRIKPWGTAHALLCAKDEIGEDNFAVINADDFYGRDTFCRLTAHFADNTDKKSFCMVGYVLKNTLTENGTVSRGVCTLDANGKLVEINERTKIRVAGSDAEYFDGDEWIHISGDSVVSMNCWGLTPEIFPYLEAKMKEFMADNSGDALKKEIYLPMVVDAMMKEGMCDVRVYTTSSQWYGVTYPDDKPMVVESINRLIDNGEYKSGLWSK